MRVLVTGAGGHVGGAIATQLSAAGHAVVGLGRRAPRAGSGLATSIAADLGRPGLAGRLATEQAPCQAIVHAAAALELDPHAASVSLTNGLGTQQMIELSERWQVSSLVFLSSVPVVGRPRELPVREDHPVGPLTAYHASKLYGEQLVAIAGRAGTPAVTLRLSAPVGPGMAGGRILPTFIRRALLGQGLEVAGRGTRGQDYVDVRDIAAATAACIEQQATGLLNIASGRCVTNLELAQRCVQALGGASEIGLSGRPDPEDDVRWEVSTERAQLTLGYRPQHSLEDSILALADQLREPAG